MNIAAYHNHLSGKQSRLIYLIRHFINKRVAFLKETVNSDDRVIYTMIE